jgi:hypothetical protein
MPERRAPDENDASADARLFSRRSCVGRTAPPHPRVPRAAAAARPRPAQPPSCRLAPTPLKARRRSPRHAPFEPIRHRVAATGPASASRAASARCHLACRRAPSRCRAGHLVAPVLTARPRRFEPQRVVQCHSNVDAGSAVRTRRVTAKSSSTARATADPIRALAFTRLRKRGSGQTALSYRGLRHWAGEVVAARCNCHAKR